MFTRSFTFYYQYEQKYSNFYSEVRNLTFFLASALIELLSFESFWVLLLLLVMVRMLIFLGMGFIWLFLQTPIILMMVSKVQKIMLRMLWMNPASRIIRQTIYVIERTCSEPHQQNIMKQMWNINGQTASIVLLTFLFLWQRAIINPQTSCMRISTKKTVGFYTRTKSGKMKLAKHRNHSPIILLLSSQPRLLYFSFIGVISSIESILFYIGSYILSQRFSMSCFLQALLDFSCSSSHRKQQMTVNRQMANRMIQAVRFIFEPIFLNPPVTRMKVQGIIKDCIRLKNMPKMIFFRYRIIRKFTTFVLLNILEKRQLNDHIKSKLSTNIKKFEKLACRMSDETAKNKGRALLTLSSLEKLTFRSMLRAFKILELSLLQRKERYRQIACGMGKLSRIQRLEVEIKLRKPRKQMVMGVAAIVLANLSTIQVVNSRVLLILYMISFLLASSWS